MVGAHIDQQVITKLLAICAGETDHITLMSAVAGKLFHTVDGFDWVGFYRVVAPGVLQLGPHQGGHGCLVIPFYNGVCGAAAREQQTQIVDDVHQFDSHIACAASTRSELVIPVFDNGQNLVAVVAIDYDQPAFFSRQPATQLETLLAKLFGSDEAAKWYRKNQID